MINYTTVSLHFMYSNFCLFHQSLKTTRPVAARIARQPWKREDVIALLQIVSDRLSRITYYP